MGSTDKGWIKLHRRILEDDIWLTAEPFSKRDAWIDLLLMAAYQKQKISIDGKATDILPGQIVTSFSALSRRWRWSRDKVRRFIRQVGHIQIDRVDRQCGKCLLTIENWALYQGTDRGNRQGKPTPKPTPRSINKEEGVQKNGMEQLTPVPADQEDDDEGITLEEYQKQWETFTNSTGKTSSGSSRKTT